MPINCFSAGRRMALRGSQSYAALIASGILCLAACMAPAPVAAQTTVAALPPLGADLKKTSVSGLSSGAYMAAQFQFAHGDLVVGAGLIGGGPYGCAESRVVPRVSVALFACMGRWLSFLDLPNVEDLRDGARKLASAGAIAKLETLKTDRVYLFAGRNDETVSPSMADFAKALYGALELPAANVKLRNDVPAGHGLPTLDNGNDCAITASPYIMDCDIDVVGRMLAHIYGPLQEPPAGPPDGQIIRFEQRAYFPPLPNHSLGPVGLAFVPRPCETESGCRVHVAFHGCNQSVDHVQEAFVTDTGYLRWAAANRIIVLFPQIAKNWSSNPQGCWDWWGYTGGDAYLTRQAPQIRAVRAMLGAVAKPKTGQDGTAR